MTALPYPIRGMKLNLESLFTRVTDGWEWERGK